MPNRSTHIVAALAILFLLGAAAAIHTPHGKGKGQGQKPDQQEKEDKEKKDKAPEGRSEPAGKKEDGKPAPLFTGKMGLKSSRQSKDQATLGFNGIGPDGKVEQAMLQAQPTGEDVRKAKRLSTYSVDSGELDYFVEEGQLKPPPGKQGEMRPHGEDVLASKQDAAARKEERP